MYPARCRSKKERSIVLLCCLIIMLLLSRASVSVCMCSYLGLVLWLEESCGVSP